jgi:hypothetical protein
MTDPEQDEVFEAHLKRRPVLPALDNEIEPPAALDAKVLSQARQAIQPTKAAVDGNTTPLGAAKPPSQRPPRWAVPMALAATLLLCLSVVINISLNTNRPSPNLERMTAARADVKTSALANATAESDAAAGLSAPSAARDALAANSGERRESVSGDIPSHEVVLPRAKVVGAPAPHAPVVAESAAPAEASEQKPERSVADAANQAPAAMASANSAAPVSPADAGGSANVSGKIGAAPGGSANVSGGARAVPGVPSAADKAVLMAKEAGVVAPQYTPAPEPERAAASARKEAKAAVVAPHPADPKVWLRQIAALGAAGKTDEAEAEMRRFKVAFPDYSAPPTLPKWPKAQDPPLQ